MPKAMQRRQAALRDAEAYAEASASPIDVGSIFSNHANLSGRDLGGRGEDRAVRGGVPRVAESEMVETTFYSVSTRLNFSPSFLLLLSYSVTRLDILQMPHFDAQASLSRKSLRLCFSASKI
ncbi:hypothetical protein BKA70DRAFT_1442967 [Coprinopsis sp. MPI-PUGE-AT-0042]|nr:hypothetical protein BKA70DRAFT_1442967 [Coprinopsis sp. MPI-PUGE-AT-0042]